MSLRCSGGRQRWEKRKQTRLLAALLGLMCGVHQQLKKLWESIALFSCSVLQCNTVKIFGILRGYWYVLRDAVDGYLWQSINIFAISVDSGTVLQRWDFWCRQFHQWCTPFWILWIECIIHFGFTVVGLIAAFVCVYCINSMAASEFVGGVEVLYFLLGKLVLPS